MASLSTFLAGPALAGEYAESRAKALALMAMEASPAQFGNAPHNWCHCGNCESIEDGKTKALDVIEKDCCKKKDECMPDACPECKVGKFTWKQQPNDPGRWYLWEDASLRGGWDIKARVFRPYSEKTGWGPYSKAPCLPPPDGRVSAGDDEWVKESVPEPEPRVEPTPVRPQTVSYTVMSTGACSSGSCAPSGGRFFRR